WLEQVRSGLLVHTTTGVTNGQQGVSTLWAVEVVLPIAPDQLLVACFNRQLPTPRQGIAGVDDQIQENHFDLPRIGLDQVQGGVQDNGQLDVLADERA